MFQTKTSFSVFSYKIVPKFPTRRKGLRTLSSPPLNPPFKLGPRVFPQLVGAVAPSHTLGKNPEMEVVRLCQGIIFVQLLRNRFIHGNYYTHLLKETFIHRNYIQLRKHLLMDSKHTQFIFLHGNRYIFIHGKNKVPDSPRLLSGSNDLRFQFHYS